MIYEQYKAENGKISLRLSITEDIKEKVKKYLKEKISSNLADEEIKQLINDYNLIDITSFQYLKKDSTNIWKEMFDSVEFVFNRMTDEKIADYVSSFIIWHYQIIKLIYQLENVENQTELLYDFCIQIGNDIMDLEERLNFYPHILEYVDKLPIIENPDIGTREQDSPETTFHTSEIKSVCCLIVMVKLYLPVIAAMIAACKKPTITKSSMVEGTSKITTKKQRIIDTNMKEVYCLYFIEPVLRMRFEEIYDKLFNYSTHFVEKRNKKTKSGQSATDVFANQSIVETNIQVVAYVLCKKCIHLSLYAKSENIIGFILSEISTKIANLETANNKYSVRHIQMGNDNEDEGNESQLEADTLVCTKLMDYEPCIQWLCDLCIESIKNKYNISDELFNEVEKYNFSTLMYVEKYTLLFLNTVFTNQLKSCEAVYSLDIARVTKLLSLVQIIAVNKKMYDLAIRLTAKLSYFEGELEQIELTPETDQMIFTANEAGNKLYVEALGCKTRLDPKTANRPLAESNISKIRDIGMYFAKYKTYINICPSLGKLISKDLITDKPIEYVPSRYLLFQFCQMMQEKV